MNFRSWQTLCLVGLLACSSPLGAEDRALPIGVGHYRLSETASRPRENIDLPGIAIDIAIMREVAQQLGFHPAQIKVLQDQEATLARVEQALQDWLLHDTSAKNRILLYFSGHGTQVPDRNGDESDHVDEVLALYDMNFSVTNGQTTLSGVLLDDRLHTWLTQIKSQDILVLVDACHSGSVHKAVKLRPSRNDAAASVSKLFRYAGMPLMATGSFALPTKGTTPSRLVVLAAAQDYEESVATPKGSLFTLGLPICNPKSRRFTSGNTIA